MIKTLLDRRYRLAIVTGVLIIIAALVVGFTNMKSQVEIFVDGKIIPHSTESTRVKEIIKEANITLGENDGYILDTSRVKDGSKIEVIRAFSIKVNNQGKELVVKSGRATVKDVLKQAGIDYGGKTVFPSLSERPKAEQTIYILGDSDKLVVSEEAVKFKTREVADNTMNFGVRQVKALGEHGKKTATYKIAADGTKILLSEQIILEPKEEVVNVGRIGSITTDRGVFKYSKVHFMEATAYTPDLNGYGSGYTATGVKAAEGQVAVDPRVIPLGSKVYVEGYGYAVATDTGGAIKGNRIDVVIEGMDRAYRFGRRDVKVYILE